MMLRELDADYDELVRLRAKEALLDKVIDYLRHHLEEHKSYDFPYAKELLSEYDRLAEE